VDLGCVRLSERHLRHDPPEPAEVAATLATSPPSSTGRWPWFPDWPVSAPTAGWSDWPGRGHGAMLEQGLVVYNRDRVHHARLTRDAVAGWTTRLAAMTAARRADLPGMVEGRQDVIVGGLLVLDQVMARFDFDQLLVSESDILDGLVASLR